jgi:HK97 family phage major capsid protein
MQKKYEKYTEELRRLKQKIERENRQPTLAETNRAEYLLDLLDGLDDGVSISGSNMNMGLIQPETRSGRNVSRERSPFKSFGEQLQSIARAGTPGGQVDQRLHQVRAATGLSEGIGGDGGFLVQDSYSNEIFSVAWNEGQLAKLCKKVRVGGNSNNIKIPGVDETSRADGSRQGGTRGYWVAEAAEKTASQPKFRRVELNLNKLVILTYVTDELLEDANALGDFVLESTAKEMAFMIDKNLVQGTGAGRPLGIKNAGCTITVSKETGQAASTIVYENVLKMWASLFPSSHNSAVWLINQAVIPQLYTMSHAVGTGGAPVFVHSQMMSEGPAGYLFGRPVIAIETCESLGTSGDIYLCDFRNGYVIADKGPAQNAWSIHTRFIYDETVFRSVYRIDGQPFLAAPITPHDGGDTLSHFLRLEDR